MNTEELHTLNVLLAYDNPRTCRAILRVFSRVSSQLHDRTLFKVDAFKFSLLERMDPSRCADELVERPEIAVVAFGEAGAPGAALLGWLEIWAKCHAGKEAALGLLPLGPATGKTVRRFIRLSKEIATRYGLNFICDEAFGLQLFQQQCN